jgi:hypothetical protein
LFFYEIVFDFLVEFGKGFHQFYKTDNESVLTVDSTSGAGVCSFFFAGSIIF